MQRYFKDLQSKYYLTLKHEKLSTDYNEKPSIVAPAIVCRPNLEMGFFLFRTFAEG